MTKSFYLRLDVAIPVIQAPMAGTSTPELAAAVCNAGGLGSIAVGAVKAGEAEHMIAEVRQGTSLAFNVNVFCHRPARADRPREDAWRARHAGLFEAYRAQAPASLDEIYTSFAADERMQALLLQVRPSVVSFHFGLPPAEVAGRLKSAGIALLATATSLEEARLAATAGVDAIVAQGLAGEWGYGAQGAPLSRPMPAAALMATLAREIADVRLEVESPAAP